MTSTGYRWPLYDGDASPANSPLQHDQPGDHPTRSANVTAPFRPRRHRLSARDYRAEMTVRFAIWEQITGVAGPSTTA